MKEELQALERLYDHVDANFDMDDYVFNKAALSDFILIERTLKILQTIIDKRVNMDDFVTSSELFVYNQFKPEWKQLTQEEFDFLKSK